MGICNAKIMVNNQAVVIRHNPIWKDHFNGAKVDFVSTQSLKIFKVFSSLFNQDVVLKIYSKGDNNMQELSKEISILSKVDHLSVISLLDYFQDRKNIIMVFEYFSSTMLLEYLGKLEKGMKKSIFDALFVDLLASVNHLHSHGYAHRNINFDNITITDSKVQIMGLRSGDYFLMDDQRSTELPWKTSEQKLPFKSLDELKGEYDEKADVWALGVIFYTLLFGIFPFVGKTTQEMIEAIKRGPSGAGFAEGDKDPVNLFIMRMLEIDSNNNE